MNAPEGRRGLDADTVQAKLIRLDELVRRLQPRVGLTGDGLRDDDMLRDSTLWILLQLVTLGAAIGAHVTAARLGRTAATYGDTFGLLAEAGAIDEDLIPALRGAAGMRNVLAHEYEEIDLDIVAAALPSAVATFATLRRQVAAWLLTLEDPPT